MDNLCVAFIFSRRSIPTWWHKIGPYMATLRTLKRNKYGDLVWNYEDSKKIYAESDKSAFSIFKQKMKIYHFTRLS